MEMVHREDHDPQIHGWVTGRRVAAGLALSAVILAGCGNTDVDVSVDDFLPGDDAAGAEVEQDPELDGHIGDMASATAESVTGIMQANGIEPTNELPDALYYVGPPDGERFMISLELADGPDDLSAGNLQELRITRFYEDENGGTSDSIKFWRPEGDDSWVLRVIQGRDIGVLGGADTSVDSQTAQTHVAQMLDQLETTAQVARG